MQKDQLPILVPVAFTDRLPPKGYAGLVADIRNTTPRPIEALYEDETHIFTPYEGTNISKSVTHWYEPRPEAPLPHDQQSAIEHAFQFLSNDLHFQDGAKPEALEIVNKLKKHFLSLR